MRRAGDELLKTHGIADKTRRWYIAQLWVTFALLHCCLLQANPAISQTQDSPLSPPINHEAGRIEEVITATDSGYQSRQYVLTWRSMRIVVAAASDEAHAPGDSLNVVVYRSDINSHKILRFESTPTNSNENVVDDDSTHSSASITLGAAQIEDTVSAESDGYRFVGYFVIWHNQRVFVVDPQSAPARATGETINFRVLRTGLGASQRLSFSM
jgi:hypothetical protein